MSARLLHRVSMVVLLLMVSACASLSPTFEKPSVTVKAFRAVPSQTITPEFVIDLHVVNPNRQSLALQGLSYSAAIEGHKVLTGVSNELPVVAGYGEADLSVTASPDLMGGIRLMSDLMRNQRDGLRYALTIKLDVGTFMPAIYLTEEGKIDFNGSVQR